MWLLLPARRPQVPACFPDAPFCSTADTMFLDERYLAQRSKKGLAHAVLAPSFGQVVNEHAVAAVAVRHPSLVAEQLLAPVAAAFAGAGEATFTGTTAVDVVPSGRRSQPRRAAPHRRRPSLVSRRSCSVTCRTIWGSSHARDGRAPSPTPTHWCSRQPTRSCRATTTMAWPAPSGDFCGRKPPQPPGRGTPPNGAQSTPVGSLGAARSPWAAARREAPVQTS